MPKLKFELTNTLNSVSKEVSYYELLYPLLENNFEKLLDGFIPIDGVLEINIGADEDTEIFKNYKNKVEVTKETLHEKIRNSLIIFLKAKTYNSSYIVDCESFVFDGEGNMDMKNEMSYDERFNYILPVYDYVITNRELTTTTLVNQSETILTVEFNNDGDKYTHTFEDSTNFMFKRLHESLKNDEEIKIISISREIDGKSFQIEMDLNGRLSDLVPYLGETVAIGECIKALMHELFRINSLVYKKKLK